MNPPPPNNNLGISESDLNKISKIEEDIKELKRQHNYVLNYMVPRTEFMWGNFYFNRVLKKKPIAPTPFNDVEDYDDVDDYDNVVNNVLHDNVVDKQKAGKKRKTKKIKR